MRPEPRLLSLGAYLPGTPLSNESLASSLGSSADDLFASTGIEHRHHAGSGQGPSDLARHAAERALAAGGASVEDLSLIVFATATPDVTFPGSACYLQDKLGAPTIGAIDVRAQSAGFLAGLDLALAFASVSGSVVPAGGRVLLAAGEVFSSGLDYSPAGIDLTPRLADGAAVALVGEGPGGIRVAARRWLTDGALVDRFWCEFPASRRYPLRIIEEDLQAGRHFPRADLPALAPIVRDRLVETCREVLEEAGWDVGSLETAIVDYVDPRVARVAATDLGIEGDRVDVPTERFGHVMAAGLPLGLVECKERLAPGARLLVAAAGAGLSWGAAALEIA